MLYRVRCVVYCGIICSLVLFCLFYWYATRNEHISLTFRAVAIAYLLIGLTILITTTLFFCKSDELNECRYQTLMIGMALSLSYTYIVTEYLFFAGNSEDEHLALLYI